MPKGNKQAKEATGSHEHPTRNEIMEDEKKKFEAAHEQAEKDIEADPEFSAHSPNDDLDEGETARLGENTDLI